MRILLLVLLVGLAGCAASPHGGVAENRATVAFASGPARGASGQTVQKRGLPLTRGQKIVLWTSVAVLTACLMAESADEDGSAFGGY